jgi:acetyl esterase/lipase
VLQPAKQTPPTFMVVASDDNLAPASAACYAKLRAAGVLVEAHVYLKGGHGFGMTGRTPAFRDLPLAIWPDRLRDWMNQFGYLGH